MDPKQLFITLSDTQDSHDALNRRDRDVRLEEEEPESNTRSQSPPPRYPISEASTSPRPPPFSSLYRSTAEVVEAYKTVTEAGASGSVPAYYAPTVLESQQPPASSQDVAAETKAALPQDTKGESSKKDDDNEPPPAYSEGFSPLDSFTFLMAATGGPASIITQVQQNVSAPINTLGGMLSLDRIYFMIAD